MTTGRINQVTSSPHASSPTARAAGTGTLARPPLGLRHSVAVLTRAPLAASRRTHACAGGGRRNWASAKRGCTAVAHSTPIALLRANTIATPLPSKEARACRQTAATRNAGKDRQTGPPHRGRRRKCKTHRVGTWEGGGDAAGREASALALLSSPSPHSSQMACPASQSSYPLLRRRPPQAGRMLLILPTYMCVRACVHTHTCTHTRTLHVHLRLYFTFAGICTFNAREGRRHADG